VTAPAAPADAEERRRALDATTSFIVQAPAGSGKTSLLIQRYLVLLAGVERPEEILAITFTRKAAAEMRSRIMIALTEARHGVRPQGAFEASVFDLATAALGRDAAEGWGLLHNPARLQIMTLDAFNARLAAAMPVDSGMGGAPQLLETRADEAIYEHAADATLDWLDDSGPAARAVDIVYRHMDSSPARWRRDLSAMLKRRDQWLPLVSGLLADGLGEARRRSEAKLASLIADVIRATDHAFPAAPREEFVALMRGAIANLRDAQPDAALAGVELPDHWPAPGVDARAFWQTVVEFCLTGQGTWRKQLNKNLGFNPADKKQKARFMALLAELSQSPVLDQRLNEVRRLPSTEYTDHQWRVIAALLSVLPLCAGELLRLFRERSQSDYTELAAAAISALHDPAADGPTDLALSLDYRLRHVLVDEMQDTSTAQYRLIETLIEGWQPGDGRSLFCVGDPMQSIYRFRAADVSRFLDAWSKGVGDYPLQRLTLSTNFRSDARIVDWINEAFSRVLGDSDVPALDAVAYSASTPRPGAPQGGEIRVLASVDDEAGEVGLIVDEIAALRRARPDDTICLLVRSRSHLEGILPALRDRGVACATTEIDRLTDLPEVSDLIALTRAVAHCGDRIAWLAVLRAPWIGMPLAAIDAIVQLPLGEAPSRGADEAQVLALLRSAPHRALMDDSVRAAVDRFLGCFEAALDDIATTTLRDAVERLWCQLGGPALLDSLAQVENAWRYLDTLETFERAGQLDDVSRLEEQLDDLRVSDAVPGARVFAMTIFKAKGLEFDHVFLPRLNRATRPADKAPLAWQIDSASGDVLLSAAEGADGDRSDALHDFLNDIEREKSRNELDRLLYVACTRARKSLYLSGNQATNQSGDLATPRANTLLGRLWPVVQHHYASHLRVSGAERVAVAPRPAPLIAPQRRWIRRAWQAPPIELSLDTDIRLAEPANDYEVEYDWVGATARRIGTVVHGWLQRLAGEPDPAAFLSAIDDLDARHARLLAAAGVPARELDDAVARVREALTNCTRDPAGLRILSNSHPDSRAEFALSGVLGGQVFNVVIDRVIVDEAGDWWLIDYKTSRHEGGGLEHFFAEEARRYAPQLLRYRALFVASRRAAGEGDPRVRLALYFPMHRHLQAVEPDG
jgi:ATP-dependent exoDNAse (exonuclease V) beta subunit